MLHALPEDGPIVRPEHVTVTFIYGLPQ